MNFKTQQQGEKMNKTEKGKRLLKEQKEEFLFYSKRQQVGYIRRVKNFSNTLNPSDPSDESALMCCDIIATRLDIDL
jgi:hypothetical protein